MNLKNLMNKRVFDSRTRRISDTFGEIKKKEVNQLFKYVINASNLQNFDDVRDWYSAGVYGWNADVWGLDWKVAIVAGYRPFGDIKAPYDLVKEYSEKAKGKSWQEKDALLREFAQKVLAAKGISDSRRRVKDNVTHEMYMCDVWVSFDEKDKEDIYNDSYISKSNGQRYTSEDYMNGDELDLEGEFQPTFDDAFDEAIQLCYKLAEKFPNDPYIINIDKFDVDDETGDVDNADSYATYNAWFNEYTGKIMWVG